MQTQDEDTATEMNPLTAFLKMFLSYLGAVFVEQHFLKAILFLLKDSFLLPFLIYCNYNSFFNLLRKISKAGRKTIL